MIKNNLYEYNPEKFVEYNLSSKQIDFIIKDNKVKKIIVAESDITKNLVAKYNYIIISNKNSKGNLYKSLFYFLERIDKKDSKYIFHVSNKYNYNAIYLPTHNFKKYGIQYKLYEKKYMVDNLSFRRCASNENYDKNRKNILLLHDTYWDYVPTIHEYNASFKKYTKNEIIMISDKEECFKLSEYFIKTVDIICISFSSWIWFQNDDSLLNHYKNINEKLKFVIFLQDEYFYRKDKKQIIKNMDLIFTVIDEKTADLTLVKNKKYKQVLTGYVQSNLKKVPINKKNILIFYRGRKLHYRFGTLGYDKIQIGKKMKEYGVNNNIPNIDIEWEEDKRIYGDDWIKTLSNSKVTLATESGCKIFDEIEELREKIDKKIIENPNYSYEDAENDFSLNELEKYNTCGTSPKMFEAVSLGTVLIMYPGNYAGIFKKDIHYIELQKDFSNIEDVMKKVHDDNFLQNMADRAYKDLIESGRYTYKSFISKFDGWLDDL
jgi:hypothetical protein